MVKKKNIDKKGWLRVVEAFISILLVLGAVLYLMQNQVQKINIDNIIDQKISDLMQSISKNEDLRTSILNSDNSPINDYIKKNIPNSWNYATKICNPDIICTPDNLNYDKAIYSSEIIVSSNLLIYNPKKLRLSVWVK